MKTNPNEPIIRIENYSTGLTKREYIATQIATGICANDSFISGIPEAAISMADELIRTLNKPIAHDE